MKRTFLRVLATAAFACSAMFFAPVAAQAEDPELLPEPKSYQGIYIEPKIVVGYQTAKATPFEKKEHSWRIGFTVAAGYDFYKTFDVPLRLEIEYGFNQSLKYDNAVSQTVPLYEPNYVKDEDGNYVEDSDGNYQVDTNQPTTRTEAAMSYEADTRFQTALVNLYYDFHYFGNFVPYVSIGAGAGFVTHHVKATIKKADVNSAPMYKSMDKTKAVFAGQVGAGFTYHFTDNVAADLGYRYLKLQNAKFDDISDDNGMTLHQKFEAKRLDSHQIMAGLRYTF